MSLPLRPTRRSTSWRVAAVALALHVLAACGGGDGGPSAPPPVPVARVTTGAAVDTVFVGDRHTLAAQPVDASGNPLAGRAVTWTSGTPLVASVDGTGVVAGLVPGQTTVTATSEGQSATITVVVLPQPVARVVFADTLLTRDVGDTASSAVRLYDRNGALLPGRPVAYASDRPAVATVDATTGAIAAHTPGTALISATSEGRIGTLRVVVLPPPPVARVTFTGGALTLDEGASAVVSATPYDSIGRPLRDRAIAFTSTAPGIATVTPDGRVTAVAAGAAAIVATSEGRSATLAVTVARVPVASVSLAVRATALLVGDTATVVVTARSATGTTLLGRQPTFTSDAPAVVAIENAAGLLRAVAPGSATITATLEGKSQTVRVDVAAATPAQLVIAPAGLTLDIGRTASLAVTATDRNGRPVPVAGVAFTSSAPAIATVDAATGLVRAVAAGTATVTAAAGTLRATATVSVRPPAIVPPPTPVTGSGPYAIDLRFVGTASADLQAIARRAADRWAQIIVAALPPQRVDVNAGACDSGTPAVHETIQNLVVLVQIGAIDGRDGIVAYAGPCVYRDSPDGRGTGLPSLGSITLDSVDLRSMLNSGFTTAVQDVVTHEMGHILGLGTLWDSRWNPNRVLLPLWDDPSADLLYVGGAAMQASATLGFTPTAAAPVPVENLGGDGTRGGHWRESTFWSELMTGWISLRGNPLSTLTVGALRDLGYSVSETRADPFSPAIAAPPGVRANRVAEPRFFINERILQPRRVRDASGRIIVLPPGEARRTPLR